MSTGLRTSTLALVLVLCSATPAQGAPTAVGKFDRTTWAQWKDTLPRPSVVVFTTTDCEFCPATIDALARAVRKKGRAKANLVVVVMDGAGKDGSLLADAHYRRADALYAFDGQEMALRYSINPAWRGITPYVALLPGRGEIGFFTGRPSAAALEALLRAR